MNETLIEVKNVKKSFQIGENENVIIDGLNLNIQKGDFSVIMGASGSGKSTILYMLSGMDKATAGYLKKNPKSEILERSKKLLVQVGLENEMYKKPSQVSGGQA